MELISTGAAALRLDVHRNTILDWIKSGELRAVRNPGKRGHYRVPVSEVERIEKTLRPAIDQVA